MKERDMVSTRLIGDYIRAQDRAYDGKGREGGLTRIMVVAWLRASK